MQVPNVTQAIVEPGKPIYLRDSKHPQNNGKWAFFYAFGFTLHAPDILAVALRRHGIINSVVGTRTDRFGVRYEVFGPLTTPDGRNPHAYRIWQIDHGATIPRLITTYGE